jgi:hypothetical protein
LPVWASPTIPIFTADLPTRTESPAQRSGLPMKKAFEGGTLHVTLALAEIGA